MSDNCINCGNSVNDFFAVSVFIVGAKHAPHAVTTVWQCDNCEQQFATHVFFENKKLALDFVLQTFTEDGTKETALVEVNEVEVIEDDDPFDLPPFDPTMN